MERKGFKMFYEIKENTDGQTYCFLSSDSSIEQSDVDDIIASFDADGINDWNIDDICAELEKIGVNLRS